MHSLLEFVELVGEDEGQRDETVVLGSVEFSHTGEKPIHTVLPSFLS